MIYALVGQTNSGKTTLLNSLKKLGYESIITYTTRPIRDREEDGVDYHFIDDDEYFYMEYMDFLASKFEAENGWKYGININDLKFDKKYVIVIEPHGLRSLIRRVGKSNVTSIYLDIPLSSRISRGLKRDEDTFELIRRLDSDEKDFKNFEDEADYTLDSLLHEENLEYILKIIGPK